MELTQQLECTQELYQTEKTCPEQIAFLGICGTKYPVLRGPNKIGRDPQKCSITLDFKSISRQHAVLVVNKTDYLLMDLDAANKTKLAGKTLQPYVPIPIKDGDTVQFGEVIGIFRVLEEEDDLPMTQAIDIPDTPVATRCFSKSNVIATTIPESPDVSDRDDSFIVPSQPKFPKKFKSPKNFIKATGKTISIQPVGSNKIDNVYWSSSKRSLSLSMDESNNSLNDSMNCDVKTVDNNDKTVYEMDTQVPPCNGSTDSIYTAETQVPNDFVKSEITSKDKNEKTIHEMNTQVPPCNESTDSIYAAETEVPSEFNVSPSIHSLETQLPTPADNLPEVCKIVGQQNLHFDIFTANTESENNIFNEETQPALPGKNEDAIKNEPLPGTSREISIEKSNTSDHEILLRDIENELFSENFESQNILSEDVIPIINTEENIDSKSDEPGKVTNIKHSQPLKRVVRIKSDSSTDCEDISDLTQKLPEDEKKVLDDDLTDCEDDFLLDVKKLSSAASTSHIDNIEDMPTQIIEGIETKPEIQPIEDMLTQVIVETVKPEITSIEDMPTQIRYQNDVDIEDLPTQVLPEDVTENVFSEEIISPFKVPSLISVKKRKDTTDKLDSKVSNKTPTKTIVEDDDEKYYAATQELFDDLCSQRELTPERINEQTNKEQGSKDNYSSSSDIEDNKICVDSLTSQQVRDIIGVDKQIAALKKMPSGSSDSDLTPTKLRPFKFTNMDLPNSQEIKCHRSLTTQSVVTESSSESEIENDSEEHTPILFKKKKKKVNANAKINLTEKFDADQLPTRILTRVRKPTSTYQNYTSTILKPRYLPDQEHIDIDKDVILENISRLKNNAAKIKSKGKEERISDVLKESQSRNTVKEEDKKDTTKDTSKEKPDPDQLNGKQIKNTDSKEPTKRTSKVKSKDKSSASTESVKKLRSAKNTESKKKTDKKDSEIVKESDLTTLSRNTRSSRTKKLETKLKNDENESKKIDKEKKEAVNKKNVDKKEQPVKVDKCKRPHKVMKLDSSSESEKEVRRSKRQRSKKEEVKDIKLVSILKKTNTKYDHSTVYNVSSESNVDSPRPFKRPASDCIEELGSKRTRSNNSSLSSRLSNTSLNSTASNVSMSRSTSSNRVKPQYVLFTAFPCEEVRSKLEKLGAKIVTDVTSCTVVLTMQIKRTFKLLCAVGLGKPIVGPSWVQACVDSNTIVDPWLYLMKDEAAESRFKFSLRRTLAGKRNFLKGYKVSSTPAVMPNAQEMKLIVESSGGTWEEDLPNWVCVSTSADKSLWPTLRRRGAIVVSTEFILGGVLRQKLDVDGNKLK